MPKIFISYRRDDTGGHAGRLRDRLIQRFGDANVFRDLDRIAAGANFISSIQEAVGECDVFLALIGKQWLTIADERGRRLDDESDFVRLEIATALQRAFFSDAALWRHWRENLRSLAHPAAARTIATHVLESVGSKSLVA